MGWRPMLRDALSAYMAASAFRSRSSAEAAALSAVANPTLIPIITGIWGTQVGDRFDHEGSHYQLAECASLPKLPTRIGPVTFVEHKYLHRFARLFEWLSRPFPGQ